MNDSEKRSLQNIANTIRGLSIDGVEAANSGHPGLPLGAADLAAYLYAAEMRYNPSNPNWMGRDRFVLSAGHGSMLLYSCLHLAGYDLPLDALRNFRQLHSPTPGHPEYGEAPGVETTTGPLGQGLATAAGIALGQKMVAARFDVEGTGLLDSKVWVLCGDGCLMEGVASEASSLAGHLRLDNLVVIYDSNDICLDGATTECFTEDTKMRYKAYGWHVVQIDGHDFEQIAKAYKAARKRKGQPTLIVAKTVIGLGAPQCQGTNKAHGAPLGEEQLLETKKHFGLPADKFYIPEDVKAFFAARAPKLASLEKSWNRKFKAWSAANPEKAAEWKTCLDKTLPADFDEQLRALEVKAGVAGRVSSQAVLQKLHDLLPFVVGGSADLSCSDSTMMKAGGVVKTGAYNARNIKYGVREFGMGAMNSGLALQGMMLPYCGTFMTFSDYMRNAIRLASLMKLRVVYQFTHESIFLGEDGPTHQPVEHLASLRAMPGLTVIRPADSNEVKAAWSATMRVNGPVVLALSRQGLKDLAETNRPWTESVGRGAYVAKKESGSQLDYCLMASGSEVALALDVAAKLEEQGKSARVVSFPCFELFDAQDKAYRDSVLGDAKHYWSLEAGVSLGWHKYIGRDGQTVSVETFGASAPAKKLAEHFGFTVEKILARMAAQA